MFNEEIRKKNECKTLSLGNNVYQAWNENLKRRDHEFFSSYCNLFQAYETTANI